MTDVETLYASNIVLPCACRINIGVFKIWSNVRMHTKGKPGKYLRLNPWSAEARSIDGCVEGSVMAGATKSTRFP